MYWRHPGESGLPTEVAWYVNGAEIGPLQWPAPRVFSEAEGSITTYGYEDRVLLWSRVEFAADVEGEVVLRAETEFLVCRVQCVPGEITLERRVRVGVPARASSEEEQEQFRTWEDRLPVSAKAADLELEAIYSQSEIRPGDGFRAAIVVLGASRPGARRLQDSFVPDAMPGIELAVTGSRPHPFAQPGVLVTLEGRASADEGETTSRLRGVLRVHDGSRVRFIDVDLELPRAESGAAVVALDNPWLEPLETPALGVSLWKALALAFLGGLLLNGMPCVLPVLAIKVFSITELAQLGRGEVLRNGAAYAIGVLLSMLVLALVVVALQAGGTAVGWGFQFQEPLFVAVIATVLVVFALNLFGVFEITVDASRLSQAGEGGGSTRRALFEGLLAVVVATPCTAPFLSTAVGFAFASPPATIIAIFLAVGAGLAAPFVLITWVPAWSRLIPRSGPWMLQLRRLLGFALVATVVWLLWVVGRSVGTDGMTLLLGFLVLVGFAVWVYGALQSSSRRGLVRGLGLGLVALIVSGLVWLPLEPASRPASTATAEEGAVRAFDPGAVEAELALGRPVFVFFTADWCLTCKVNERAVLSSTRAKAELERGGFVTFKADWTRRDETIRRELARFGRAGVPLYLLYAPSDPRHPELLPELLTVDGFVEAVRRVGAAPASSGG
jgi:thiol:disulfide interchange protein DsbD